MSFASDPLFFELDSNGIVCCRETFGCSRTSMPHGLGRIRQAAIVAVTPQSSNGTVEMKYQLARHAEPPVRRTGHWTATVLIFPILAAILLSSAGCASDAERPYENRDRWDRRSTTDWQDF